VLKNGDEISHIGRAAYVELVIKQPLLMATIFDLAFFYLGRSRSTSFNDAETSVPFSAMAMFRIAAIVSLEENASKTTTLT